ncbi:MAG TPA: NAD(P)-dependent oxidoreductase [Bacteroidia bacterium]
MGNKNYFELPAGYAKQVKALEGPVAVLGAGGFIGINLLHALLQHRSDVFGISQDQVNNWRFIASQTPQNNLLSCDINDFTQLKDLIVDLKPKTIFNLAAYGAYSKQKEYKKIYYTNFDSSIDILELLKQQGFSAYVHAGSSSEYGLNSAGPEENSELVPNSHYALSKAAISYAIKYYGLIEKLPVLHLRLYSAYGPWEEPDRLFPNLIAHARQHRFPPFVQENISRDFIYITDILTAFIAAATAAGKEFKGKAYNIGTGKKTTMRELASQVKNICNVPGEPGFGKMQNRDWDTTDWYANIKNATKDLGWKPSVELSEGIKKVVAWQEEAGFDEAWWNWTRKK